MAYLARRSQTSITILGLVFVLLLAGLDYLTGPELSFSIFYLMPVSLVVWFAGRRVGILVSVAAAGLWLVADLQSGPVYSHATIPFWNALVRLGFFLTVTLALSALRTAKQRQASLMEFVVHDLRAPLAIILTGLQTLQDDGIETMDPDQQTIVRNGITSGQRMLTLINSLLDLARLENGKMPTHKQEVRVSDLVEESLKQVALWAERHTITLTTQLDTKVETVRADPELTVRILVNLLSNAIKFSPPCSAVTIRVAPANDHALGFSVIDRGPGIPQEWLGQVFDKFVQVDALKGGVHVGSGLGLNFCQLAAQAQGGRIWVESEGGKGTTVTFTLPIATQ